MNKGLRNSALWLIVAIILYRQIVPLTSLVKNFPLNDFSVYIDGTKVALSGENPYKQKYFDRFNYPPAAAVIFIPFVFLPINIVELIFTGLSILSVWLAVDWTLKILKWKSDKPVKWLVFALCLKMFPVKLTLALGQINLVILVLVVGAFYFCCRSKGLTLASPKVRPYEILSGVLFGLATAIKLTPAPILIYFLIRKKWKVIAWSVATILVLTLAGAAVFGWDLTRYYFVSVVPGLMGEVTKETLNASYMNQSVTALLARFGIFSSVNTFIRLVISGGMLMITLRILLSVPKGVSFLEFKYFWGIAMVSILFLPVFVWQHHFVFLLPVWIILLNNAMKSRRLFDWLAVSISYGLLNFYFKDANWLSGKNPLIISHFLLTGMIMWLLMILKRFPRASVPGVLEIHRECGPSAKMGCGEVPNRITFAIQYFLSLGHPASVSPKGAGQC